jgi:stage II sporulation protein AA (anti-sigma F factor antagonist)
MAEEIDLDIRFSNKGNTLIVNMSGELDHHYAEYIRQKIDGEILKSTTRNVIFDFSKLGFMDSSGIGVIAGRYRNIQKLNGKAAIVCKNLQINRVLEMSGILQLIPSYESLNDAVSALQGA